jgi:hypothetical protein
MAAEREYAVLMHRRSDGELLNTYRHVPLPDVWDIVCGWAFLGPGRLRFEVHRETGPLGVRFGARLVDDLGGG